MRTEHARERTPVLPEARPASVPVPAAFALGAAAALLSGCPPGPDFSTRDCSGVAFDHPAADLWAPYDRGDRIDFAGPNASAGYTVVDVDLPVPEDTAERGSVPSDEIGCAVLKTYTFRSDDGAHEFSLEFNQSSFVNTPLKEQLLSLAILTAPSRTPRLTLTFISLVPFDDTGEFTDAEVTFEDRGEVDGVPHDDLYSTRFSPSALAPFGPDEVRLEGLQLSRGTGLVSLGRSDVGELYLERGPAVAGTGDSR